MLIKDMSEAEYHARPELSSTQARRLLESPKRYAWFRDHPEPHSMAFDLGSAVHAKVLGTGWGIEELDFPDFRSKAAREARDAAYADGLIPMLAKDLVQVHDMTEAVLAHPTARALFELPGDRELTVVSEADGAPVRCRFDALTEETPQGRFAIDLKTTAGRATKKSFERAVDKYGYHVQEGHYRATWEASEGTPIAFVFVVVEKDPPYEVGIHQLNALWRGMGETEARAARELFVECTEKNEWPGIPADVQLLDPPAWAVVEHEMRFG